jgi:hypothetical protein
MWSKIIPRHNFFIDAIIHLKCHVIVTTEVKLDYSLTKMQMKDQGNETRN